MRRRHERSRSPSATTAPIDLLLTDVVMPGMRGYEVARRVRELAAQIPILFMSGYTEETLVGRPAPAGHALIEKPFAVDALARRVRETLDPRPRLECPHHAGVAQLVEHQLPKLRVVGSSPIARLKKGSLGHALQTWSQCTAASTAARNDILKRDEASRTSRGVTRFETTIKRGRHGYTES